MFKVLKTEGSDFLYYNQIVQALRQCRQQAQEFADNTVGVNVRLQHIYINEPGREPTAILRYSKFSKETHQPQGSREEKLVDGVNYSVEPLNALIQHAVQTTNGLIDDAIIMESGLADNEISTNVSKIIRENLELAGIVDRCYIACACTNGVIEHVSVTVE